MNFFRKTIATILLTLQIVSFPAIGAAPTDACDQEAQRLVQQMTLDEKIVITSGVDIYKTTGVPRLGIPGLDMTDGPVGVVLSSKYKTTGFPAGVAMAATWNPKLVGQAAAAMAKETKLEGHNVLLGPCVNIHRTALGGRNFESITGEDPYLGSQMAPAFVKEAQSQGVLTSTKHFALNNQEFDRLNLNVVADERTMNELYFPAFRSAVDAGTTSIMAAYNKVNGSYACTSRQLLRETLKQRWGFKGFAISDWGANHSTADSIQAGLDIEMPYQMPDQGMDVPPKFTLKLVKEALAKGEIQESHLNEMVRRQLSAMCRVGALRPKNQPVSESQAQALLKSHQALSQKLAEESVVLLKNDQQILPLKKRKGQSIVMIGPNATQFPAGGGGSSSLKKLKVTPPGEALQAQLGPNVVVKTAADKREGKNFNEQQAIDAAVAAAKSAETAVVFVGENETTEKENRDRASLSLTPYQSRLIEAVAKANPNTVVVINGGGATSMDPWIKDVKGIIQGWYLGQNGGEAIAGVLSGKVNPSGKLPVTFVRSRENSSDSESFPKSGDKELQYKEGIFVGYRNSKVDPLFPFGHGLSYTKFKYSNLQIRKLSGKSSGSNEVEVRFEVTNDGNVKGAEVPQLYVGEKNPRLPRPQKELKGFTKLELKPGEKRLVTLKLDRSAFSYYDPAKHDWTMDPHQFDIQIGSSSQDIRLKGSVDFSEVAQSPTLCPEIAAATERDFREIQDVYDTQIAPIVSR